MVAASDGVLTLLKNLSVAPKDPSIDKKEKIHITLLSLPNELLDVITMNLHASDKIRSLANLGLCSKRLRSVIDRLVWKEVRWQKDTWSLLEKDKKMKIPAGWKYVEFIWYYSRVTDFWSGFKKSVSTKDSDTTLELIPLARWPKLKAVIERSAVGYTESGPAMSNVWIMAENALKPLETASGHNCISHIIQWFYPTNLTWSGIARDSLQIPYPVFATEHEIASDVEGPPSWNATPSYRFMTNPSVTPDATLTDHLLLALQFHIVETRSLHALDSSTPGKSGWIWRLCCLSKEAFRPSKFPVTVKCRKWIGVLFWLYLIGTGPYYESERAPFQLRVALSTYMKLADFADPMARIQREVTHMMNGKRRGKNINENNFPSRLMVDTLNDPVCPQPNCKHAEIDLKSAETSRVVRYGQCIWGWTEHRSYMDGQLMTEPEFDEWKERTEATYSKENQSDE